MSACQHRPNPGSMFNACANETRDHDGKRACLCAAEYRADLEAAAQLDAAMWERLRETATNEGEAVA